MRPHRETAHTETKRSPKVESWHTPLFGGKREELRMKPYLHLFFYFQVIILLSHVQRDNKHISNIWTMGCTNNSGE